VTLSFGASADSPQHDHLHEPVDRLEQHVHQVRRAAPPDATVLIIEGVAGDGPPDPRVQTLDVVMLAITGGRERTVSQFAKLLDGAGLRLSTVVETPGPLRIVESTAV